MATATSSAPASAWRHINPEWQRTAKVKCAIRARRFGARSVREFVATLENRADRRLGSLRHGFALAALFALCSLAAICAAADSSTNKPPSVERLGPGIFRIGLVTIDAGLRQLRFPAEVNMTNGVIEYAIVHETGKVHESLFRTAARPLHVHLGALLLGGSNQPAGRKGCLVSARWIAGGTTNISRIESMVRDVRAKRPADDTPWRYVGSRMVDGVFLAEQNGSILGVIEDPEAVMDNPRPRRDDDENWEVIQEKIPQKPSNLEMIIDFKLPSEVP